MSSCAMEPAGSGCGSPSFGRCASLKEMVDLFLSERSDRPDQEKAWWGDPDLSMKDACWRAMFTLGNATKRDGHQWVFSMADLEAMAEQLAANATQLSGAKDFQALYRAVEVVLGLDRDRKPLLVYDIARRLGYRLGYEPQDVYLHAGPRKGAAALKPGLGRPRCRPLADFPTSIRTRLTPAQAEDFLCLAAKHLRADLWD